MRITSFSATISSLILVSLLTGCIGAGDPNRQHTLDLPMPSGWTRDPPGASMPTSSPSPETLSTKQVSSPQPRATATYATATVVITPTTPALAKSRTPMPTPTATPASMVLERPVIIDSVSGRLYAAGKVGNTRQIVALAATDGHLLTTYDIAGAFAVDGHRGRLYVDQAGVGLTVLDTQTGMVQSIIPLPASGKRWPETDPAPLFDPRTGQVLAFRDNLVLIVDPDQEIVVDEIYFDVPKGDDCRALTGPLPIVWAEYDSIRRLLYLDFITYSCTPWIGESVVSYDLNAKTQIAQHAVPQPRATAFDGYLYGGGWYRMGTGYRWAWRDGKPWISSEGWSSPASGLVVDSGRGHIYETVGGALRVFDAKTMALLMSVPRPIDGDLVGFDPGTDQLYFLAEGQLHIVPAGAIKPPLPQALLPAEPPNRPVHRLVVSPGWPQDQTLLGLWDRDLARDECFVFGVSGSLFYLSEDAGQHWGQPQGGRHEDCRRVTALAVSPHYAFDETMFIGLVGLGIFRSTDGGRLWLPVSGGLANVNITEIFVSPGFARDQTVFSQDINGTLYRSADSGATWQPLDQTYSIAMSREFDQDRTLVGLDGTDLFRSTDGGDTWQSIGQLPAEDTYGMVSLAPLFSRWQVMFAYANSGTLYRTADGGSSWQKVLELEPPVTPALGSRAQLVYEPEEEENRSLFLLVAFRDDSQDVSSEKAGLYRSKDGGLTWEAIVSPGDISPTAVAISPNFGQDQLLFVGTADGEVVTLDVATLAATE